MSQTFFHKGRRVDFDLWAFPDMNFNIDFDLVAHYAITGVWRFVPKEYLSAETRETIEDHISDKDKSWAGVIVGIAAVVIVNVIGVTLVAAGTYFVNPLLISMGTGLLSFPDLLVYKVGSYIGDYFWGD